MHHVKSATNGEEKMINLNLNCGTHLSAPLTIRMEIVNPGNTEANFKFLFPADFRIHLEGWAQHASLRRAQNLINPFFL